MARPRKKRSCRRFEADRVYKPRGVPLREMETSVVTLDQLEAMLLCDSEGLDQDAAGLRMGVSRGTVQRLLYSGRKAVVEAIKNNNAIAVNLLESEDCFVGMHSNKRNCRT